MYREQIYAVEIEVHKREFLSCTLNSIDTSLFSCFINIKIFQMLSIKLSIYFIN